MQRPNIGAIPCAADCRVPPDAVVLNLKVCEHCGCPFTRSVGSGLKYCADCRGKLLTPPTEEIFREALPVIPFHPNRPIHYDESLVPNSGSRNFRLGAWELKLARALAERGPMTREDMAIITGHVNGSSLRAVVIRKGMKFVHVGSAWPRARNKKIAGVYAVEFVG